MVVLLAAFANRIVDTLNKVLISSSVSAINANDPTPFNLTTNENSNFMLGVEVFGHDLNTGSRLFDLELIRQNWEYGKGTESYNDIKLEPCTIKHWRGYPEVQ